MCFIASAYPLLLAPFSTVLSAPLQTELLTLLRGLITGSGERRARLCALQCLNRLFPFEHVEARYLCLCAASDHAVSASMQIEFSAGSKLSDLAFCLVRRSKCAMRRDAACSLPTSNWCAKFHPVGSGH